MLLTRVLYRKRNGAKEFVIVDAAMNDLIRPAFYQSHHEICRCARPTPGTIVADVVGPVCETGDFFARDREIANALPGDLLAVPRPALTASCRFELQLAAARPRKCWWTAARGVTVRAARDLRRPGAGANKASTTRLKN